MLLLVLQVAVARTLKVWPDELSVVVPVLMCLQVKQPLFWQGKVPCADVKFNSFSVALTSKSRNFFGV